MCENQFCRRYAGLVGSAVLPIDTRTMLERATVMCHGWGRTASNWMLPKPKQYCALQLINSTLSPTFHFLFALMSPCRQSTFETRVSTTDCDMSMKSCVGYSCFAGLGHSIRCSVNQAVLMSFVITFESFCRNWTTASLFSARSYFAVPRGPNAVNAQRSSEISVQLSVFRSPLLYDL